MAATLSDVYSARAEENLQAARRNFEAGGFHAAARDAYFAAYHAANSLLLRLGLESKTHKGARILFAREVVHKRGLATPKMNEIYERLYAYREKADYPKVPVRIERETAARIVGDAEVFVREMERLRLSP